MDIWSIIQQFVRSFMERISAMIQQAAPGSIQITGILGLAAVVLGYYHLRGGNRQNTGSSNSQTGLHPRLDPSTSAPRSSNHGSQQPATLRPPAPDNSQMEPLSALAVAVRSQLSSAKRLTISSLGVLLEQQSPDDLLDGAVLQSGVADLLVEIARATDLYIITHVTNDIGEAVVMGVLEAAGITGTAAGQVKQHKVLFCSTLDGKVSVVRQIEPDLHIDASDDTIDKLKRFMPQLLHVSAKQRNSDAPNIGCVPSLAQYFSL